PVFIGRPPPFMAALTSQRAVHRPSSSLPHNRQPLTISVKRTSYRFVEPTPFSVHHQSNNAPPQGRLPRVPSMTLFCTIAGRSSLYIESAAVRSKRPRSNSLK
ncbi:hypothetical protein PIB30_069404, partial [Stylosanthes scabra]|nr:hypothetical protein [Stylosanthes scabra]